MILSTTLITPPKAEPVTLALAKQHLRVDFDQDDAYISGLIVAARQFAEKRMNRAIFNQTWLRTLDYFPVWRCETSRTPDQQANWPYPAWLWDKLTITLPHARLVSVSSISYIACNEELQTLDPSTYKVDVTSTPGRVTPAPGTVWPYVENYIPGSVQIEFVAGSWGDGVDVNTCPQTVIQAMLLLVGHWYNNRDAAAQGGMSNVPLGVDALLSINKVHRVGM